MATIPAGYTPGVWLDTDPAVLVVSTVVSNSNPYTTEYQLIQSSGHPDPTADSSAVACAWEHARAGGSTGSPFWSGTCAPIPSPPTGSSAVNRSYDVGDSVNYSPGGTFGGGIIVDVNNATFTFAAGNYVGPSWYQANPPTIPTGALIDWEVAGGNVPITSTVTDVDITFTPTEVLPGQGCSINVSPIYGVADDTIFLTTATNNSTFIMANAGGTAGTVAPGGSITVSATGADLYSFTTPTNNGQTGVVALRSSFVDADVPQTAVYTGSGNVYRAVNITVQLTITAIPARHRFLYPTPSLPAVTSPPVVSFTLPPSGNWFQDDGSADLNTIGDGKPLRFYSSSNNTDSIIVNFGVIDLGPAPSIGAADVYIVGDSVSPTLGPPITVYAADGAIIQTITGYVDPNAFASWFTLLPDVRLAGGCSIHFSVPPRPFATLQEFCISAVILELKTTIAFSTLIIQRGSGLTRFDDVLAMRAGGQ